jgi:plastocyanin
MKLLCPVLALLLSFSPAALAADVHGHAIVIGRLNKKAPSPIVYNLRGTAPPAPSSDLEPANEFDRMVVILELKDAVQPPPRSPVTETMYQKGARFQPDLIAVPVGSTVEFPNSDAIFHKVFSLSTTQPFDLGSFPPGQARSVKFDNPGVVQVHCHIHANMYGAIVVTASPWFQKPSADGSFWFANVPAGRYRLTAWHKMAGLHKVNIQVPESGRTDVTIRVPLETER